METNPQSNEQTKPAFSRGKRLQLALASLLTIVLAGVFVTQAWFYHQRSLQTLTEVHAPIQLQLQAGHGDPIASLDLGEINVMSETKQEEYIFCVYGTSRSPYTLQLAHTTNIPFTYTIYPATESSDGTGVKYVDTTNTAWYYSYDSNTPLAGNYLNRDTTSVNLVANDDYQALTYPLANGTSAYTNVQKNAKPLYWQAHVTPTASETYSLANTSSNAFRDYYVLVISWGDKLTISKETDIVYLSVGQDQSSTDDDPNSDAENNTESKIITSTDSSANG
jgi:hypothetical protein